MSCLSLSGWPRFLKWGTTDMETLHQFISPDFLLRNSVYTSVLVGLICPLVGVFLVVRRLVFMGVALPQISSTGVAVALSLPLWLGFKLPGHGPVSAHELAFTGSVTFSLGAILLLAFLERRGRGHPEGRLGTAYVVAAALSILILSRNPYGEIGWLDMLKGEVIAISNSDLVLTAATLMLVLVVLGFYHKELLLVSFDREMAIILRKNVIFWDVLLYVLIGLTVSMAVLSVGPLIAFGFLLIPALTAHLFARNMHQFTVLAAMIGGVAAFFGFWIAYQYDYPVGPTDVVLLGVLYAAAWVVARSLPAILRHNKKGQP
jgi:ABC-type Mn2+/Zn2+ transport system permease subunit